MGAAIMEAGRTDGKNPGFAQQLDAPGRAEYPYDPARFLSPRLRPGRAFLSYPGHRSPLTRLAAASSKHYLTGCYAQTVRPIGRIVWPHDWSYLAGKLEMAPEPRLLSPRPIYR